jgi:hypothetical protein
MIGHDNALVLIATDEQSRMVLYASRWASVRGKKSKSQHHHSSERFLLLAICSNT